MYNKDDIVVYGSQGVCTISNITEREGVKYYVLTPFSTTGATILVPTDNKVLKDKMHPVLSKQEIYKLIETMPKTNSDWIESEGERKDLYKKILSSGNRAELIKQIKLIYSHINELKTKKKKLHNCDEQFFNIAEKILYEEFSYVLHIDKDEVLPFITEHLSHV